jgi:hypothetical protein
MYAETDVRRIDLDPTDPKRVWYVLSSRMGILSCHNDPYGVRAWDTGAIRRPHRCT